MMRLLGIAFLVLAGCFSAATTTKGNEEEQNEEQEAFPLKPCGADIKPVPFDGKRAIKYLEAICDIGPHLMLQATLKKIGQAFTGDASFGMVGGRSKAAFLIAASLTTSTNACA